jgi:hypothetical protein
MKVIITRPTVHVGEIYAKEGQTVDVPEDVAAVLIAAKHAKPADAPAPKAR